MADGVRCGALMFVQYLEANKDKKGLAKSKEAARAKTHWDFVIEEMTWLAKVSKGARWVGWWMFARVCFGVGGVWGMGGILAGRGEWWCWNGWWCEAFQDDGVACGSEMQQVREFWSGVGE